MTRPRTTAVVIAALALALVALRAQDRDQAEKSEQGFRFRSGVELINVTATVSDANGRFVPGLQQDDFIVYEDDKQVEVTHFSAERVPVSLGIALDTSGSMAGEQDGGGPRRARPVPVRPARPIGRDLPLPLQRLPRLLLQGWTSDRQRILTARSTA